MTDDFKKAMDDAMADYTSNRDGELEYLKLVYSHLWDYLEEDVVEIKHGCWIIDGDTKCCSVCNYEISALIPFIDNGKTWLPLYADNYCGNCGAKMDGGNNSE